MHPHPVAGDRAHILELGIAGLAFLALGKARLERILHRLAGADRGRARIAIDQQLIAIAHQGAQAADPPNHRHAHGARHDHHMRCERAFLKDHALEAALVIFEQFGRAEIARQQDRVRAQAERGRRAELARNDPQQAVGQIFQVVHPVRQQRIVNLAHAHAGALLHPFDRGLGCQPAVNRFIDAPGPAFVISEHLVGLEHFLMLPALAEFGLPGHPVDLLAHLVKGGQHPLAFGFRILGHHMFDMNTRLVKHCRAHRQPLDQRQSLQDFGAGLIRIGAQHILIIHQFGVGDELGQDHGHGLQRLDLHFLVAARVDMLDAQHPHRAFSPHNRHAGKGVEFFLARFGAILEVRVSRRFSQVQRFDPFGNGSGQTFANRHAGDVNRALVEAAGREKFEHAFAQQIDRANLAIQRFADDLDHLVELGLRVQARCHHIVKTREDRTGG